ncbi:MetQ/NlpA family ABC transporter substrate-binding protein [Peribacillus psychrosaccharolyticus]|uniref:Lipoprotein n=1 Tax=Peribacillus psychrosaccharolyticus TaxID=1407 RepID=A0A974RZC4_PERPY|nr:MetQ/NlpA family ABC transporter substrate-binding protein [Peribacillus psychrosaccharolyticus]MEC2055628.1 MetQ/NlpA family ABC transporter substrate-binding protein [Peribacillus psychrosaccharolyticus]MED3743345.1 MetQ/NlpA family ABC transporter substrate-binding protein [Peribacillus psychrosaccharolyticus]QQS99290.1 MetQ/NlpA family ABC transporter substrate-binding protein [Peribacillus psychrosaccharolyticus]
MKKIVSFALILVLSFALAACGNGDSDKGGNGKDSVELVVGASNVPHAEILEKAQPLLKEKGVELKIETFQDYVLPNKALEQKDLDANYFQHIPYLEAQIAENGYDFVNAGGIHIEPIGIYSQKYKSLDELPNGAEIIMSSSVADHGRALSLLEAKGLLTLKEGIDKTTATVKDITDNPKKITFKTDIEAALLPQVYNNKEGDAVMINSNYAIDADLNPLKDSIAIEDENSPYVNVIAVRKGDENSKAIKALVEVLHSKEIQDFILEEYEGAVVPVSE